MIIFTVPGQPIGKGRPRVASRGGKFSQLYTPPKTANYEGLVALAGRTAMAGRDLLAGPVAVSLDIRLAIPVSWSEKKQAAALAGTVAATKKPDVDNCIKAIFDGMNGVVWNDDVQAVSLTACKRYSRIPGVEVTVRPLSLDTALQAATTIKGEYRAKLRSAKK